MIRTSQKRSARRTKIHPPGLWRRLIEFLRGREQILLRPGPHFPLILLTYPRGMEAAADEVAAILNHDLPLLPEPILRPYAHALAALPAMIVVVLRADNPCRCLGHCHPRGAESRLAKRLSADLGSAVGELDLAYESIRRWTPKPIAALAAGELGGRLPRLHFQAALLAVFLHELEHVAFPERAESGIRTTSNEFYAALMRELVAREGGPVYGMHVP